MSPDKQSDRYGVKQDPSAGDTSTKKSSHSKLPSVPPKIDRQKKPSKKSAAERLFGQRAQASQPEEKTAPSAGSGNNTSGGGGAVDVNQLNQNSSNSNSYNPHAAENYDSYKHRGATSDMFPHYASRNPGGQL